jgi:hypothetical protein
MSNKLLIYKTIIITVIASYRNKEGIVLPMASMVYDTETTKLFLRKPLAVNNFPSCVISLKYFTAVSIVTCY